MLERATVLARPSGSEPGPVLCTEESEKASGPNESSAMMGTASGLICGVRECAKQGRAGEILTEVGQTAPWKRCCP